MRPNYVHTVTVDSRPTVDTYMIWMTNAIMTLQIRRRLAMIITAMNKTPVIINNHDVSLKHEHQSLQQQSRV